MPSPPIRTQGKANIVWYKSPHLNGCTPLQDSVQLPYFWGPGGGLCLRGVPSSLLSQREGVVAHELVGAMQSGRLSSGDSGRNVGGLLERLSLSVSYSKPMSLQNLT